MQSHAPSVPPKSQAPSELPQPQTEIYATDGEFKLSSDAATVYQHLQDGIFSIYEVTPQNFYELLVQSYEDGVKGNQNFAILEKLRGLDTVQDELVVQDFIRSGRRNLALYWIDHITVQPCAVLPEVKDSPRNEKIFNLALEWANEPEFQKGIAEMAPLWANISITPVSQAVLINKLITVLYDGNPAVLYRQIISRRLALGVEGRMPTELAELFGALLPVNKAIFVEVLRECVLALPEYSDIPLKNLEIDQHARTLHVEIKDELTPVEHAEVTALFKLFNVGVTPYVKPDVTPQRLKDMDEQFDALQDFDRGLDAAVREQPFARQRFDSWTKARVAGALFTTPVFLAGVSLLAWNVPNQHAKFGELQHIFLPDGSSCAGKYDISEWTGGFCSGTIEAVCKASCDSYKELMGITVVSAIGAAVTLKTVLSNAVKFGKDLAKGPERFDEVKAGELKPALGTTQARLLAVFNKASKNPFAGNENTGVGAVRETIKAVLAPLEDKRAEFGQIRVPVVDASRAEPGQDRVPVANASSVRALTSAASQGGLPYQSRQQSAEKKGDLNTLLYNDELSPTGSLKQPLLDGSSDEKRRSSFSSRG